MAAAKIHDNALLWMTIDGQPKNFLIKRAVVRDGLSKLTETTVEFLSKSKKVQLKDVLGKILTIHMDAGDTGPRLFAGTVVSVETLGFRDGYTHLSAEVRPVTWMLTKSTDCRIFQDKNVKDIISDILHDRGVTKFEFRLNESYETREYCVQYRETDFDFISRLMEEEGMYYFFKAATSAGDDETLVICDGISAHSPLVGESVLDFYARDGSAARRGDHIGEWARSQHVTTGKVSLQDFDFTAPSMDLMVTRKDQKGEHRYKDFEHYDYPGHYDKAAHGTTNRARVRMEAQAVEFARWRGAGTTRNMATGATFKITGLDDFKAEREDEEFLTTDAVHYMQTTSGMSEVNIRHDLDVDRLGFPEDMEEMYSVVFGAIPKKEPFRAPLTTPWPEISSLQTATVIGASGEEIDTDEYGRILVRFHWDRVADRKTGKTNGGGFATCRIRVVTPWAGTQWGMVAVPRIGQEVVIQFEEGDPDRPICTGMLYNETNKPPYELPANKTQSGIKTNSSKGGGGFNELMFEDKKDAELVRFQSETDYTQIVKNNADITIGLEKGSEGESGNLTETVFNDKTVTVQKGDHTFSVETGSQIVTIETDNTTTVTGNQTQTVEGDNTRTITGNDDTTIKDGDHSLTVSSGDQSTVVSLGNISVSADAGKIEMEAMQSIELKVGGSSIKIEQSGVTISGPMIKLTADAMAEMKSPLTTVKADGMLTLKGSVTMIN